MAELFPASEEFTDLYLHLYQKQKTKATAIVRKNSAVI